MNLIFKGFGIQRGGNILFENINIRLNPDKYHLLGRNGCGKTTLLNCLYKLNKDYEGSILIDGVDIRRIGTRKLRSEYINYVNQKNILLDYLTIKENIYLFKKSKEEREKIINKIKILLGLNINKFVMELSGGEKKMINIIISMIRTNKPITIIDEPYNDLSIKNTKIINKLIAKLDGIVLVISHQNISYEGYKKLEINRGKINLC